MLGLWAHNEHFVIPFAVSGLAVLVNIVKSEFIATKPICVRIFIGGLLLGLAIAMEQQGLFFALFGILYFVIMLFVQRLIKWQMAIFYCSLLLLGIALPMLFTLSFLWLQEAFKGFWFWTVLYPKAYVAQMPVNVGIKEFLYTFLPIVYSNPIIWFLAGTGIIAAFWDKNRNFVFGFIILFFV